MKKTEQKTAGNLFKSALIAGACLSASLSSYAQWTTLTSGTSNNLYDVHFVNKSTGYVVGNKNTILKTTDTGSTWVAKPAPCTDCWYWDVHFINKDTGYVVGETDPGTNPNGNGVIYKTINGGTTWTNVLYSSGTPVRDLFVLNKDTMFAAGGAEMADGKIWKSVDAGKTWTPSGTTYYDAMLGGLGFFNSSRGFMAVYESVFGKVNPTTMTWLDTKDGTTTFGSTNMPSTPSYWVFATDFVSSKIGYMSRGTYVGIDSVYIRKTTDGGVSWKEAAIPGFTGSLYGMDFVDTDTGYMVGSEGFPTGKGIIRKSKDGGKTWAAMTPPIKNELRAVQFVNPYLGFAAGLEGAIIKYEIKGQSGNGIKERLTSDETLRIYPNPAQQRINIAGLENINGNTGMQIRDVAGKEMLSISNFKESSLDISQFAAGVYFVSIVSSDKIFHTKFVKE